METPLRLEEVSPTPPIEEAPKTRILTTEDYTIEIREAMADIAVSQFHAIIPSRFNFTQAGNAERLVSIYGHKLKYCHTWGKWLIWTGKQWLPDNKEEITQLALKTVRIIYAQACDLRGDDEDIDKLRTTMKRHARESEANHELRAMIDQARTQHGVAVESKDLDSTPYLFNSGNGVINLRTGYLLPHDPKLLLTKLSPISFDPSAKCPRWEQFLREVFDGSDELVAYTQRALGCSLTGDLEKALFFFIGKGDNGKTTLLEAVRWIMGDYAGLTDVNLLM
jgi:putative DNA primase/helicase